MAQIEMDVNRYSFNEERSFDHRVVYDVAEAENGHIWFGTVDGLVRFDGHYFKKYLSHAYDNEVSDIQFDAEGNVWCVNFGGQLFSVRGDSLKVEIKQSFNSNIISSYKVLKDRIIYSTYNGNRLMAYHRQTGQDSPLYIIPNNKMLNCEIFTDSGIVLMQTKGKSPNYLFDRLYLNWNGEIVDSMRVTSAIDISGALRLMSNAQGKLYLSVLNKVLKVIDFETGKIVFEDATTNAVETNTLQFFKNDLFLLKKDAAYVLDLKSGSGYKKKLLKGVSASSFMKDREENIWVSSINMGVFIIPNLQFMHGKLTDSKVTAVTMDSASNAYFQDIQGNFHETTFPYSSSRLISSKVKNVHSLFYNPFQNTVVLGTPNKIYKIHSKQLTTSGDFLQSFKKGVALDDSTFVYTFSRKAEVYSPTKNINQSIRWKGSQNPKDNSRLLLRNKRALEVAVEKGMGCYVDYIDGLMYYQQAAAPSFVTYEGNRLLVTAISSSESLGVWALVNGRSLLQLKNGAVVFSTLLADRADRIFCSGKHLLITTKKSIVVFTPTTKELFEINYMDGVIPDNFLSVTAVDSTVFLFGEHFIQQFPLGGSKQNHLPPAIDLTLITAGNKPLKEDSLYQLSYEQNDLQVNFTTIATRSRGEDKVYYRLGSNEAWRSTNKNSTTIRLPQLAPGAYQFQIKACNEHGICSQPIKKQIIIAAPYYLEWWFYLAIFLASSLLLIVFFQNRLRQKQTQISLIEEQEQLKSALYKSQTAAVQSQMNPHFLFNALNSVQDLVITKDIEGSNKYLGKFSDLLRKILKSSQETLISLEEELSIIELYLELEKLRFGDEFSYSIKNDLSSAQINGLMLPAMVIQPFVENAIKHGLFHKKGAKNLDIHFSLKNQFLVCEIEDNGIGRERSKARAQKGGMLHNGFSTEAVKKRISVMEQALKTSINLRFIDKEEPDNSGTIVRIEFPTNIAPYDS